MTWTYPTAVPVVTSPYGMRRHPVTGALKLHAGTDYRAGNGIPLYAASGGVVTRSTFDALTAGNYVRIDVGGGVWIGYSHLSYRGVAVGQRVVTGQQIGLAGQTGGVTGPHLHFEVNVGGTNVDPVPFLAARTAELAGNPGGGTGGGSLPSVDVPGIDPIAPIPEEYVMATEAQVSALLDAKLAPIIASLSGTGAGYNRPDFGNLAWLDLGTCRRRLTKPQVDARPRPIGALPLADPFWRLPMVGDAWGELYRKTGTEDAWLFEVIEGVVVRRLPTRQQYLDNGSPVIVDVPASHPFWNLPTV